MAETSIILRCAGCLALNRVPYDKLQNKPACGKCKAELPFPSQPNWIRADAYDFAVRNWPETLLVVFTAPMCLHCKIVEPLLNDLARGKAGMLKVLKVDIESETLLAERFKIEKTPTFIVYKGGIEVLRVDGAPREKGDLVKWIDNLIGFTSY